MSHCAFRVNLILAFTFSDYRGLIYMWSNVTPWVLQGFNCMSLSINHKKVGLCISRIYICFCHFDTIRTGVFSGR